MKTITETGPGCYKPKKPKYLPPLHKATIIELAGPPGTGKTTTCGYLAEMLREKELEVLTLQDIKDYIKALPAYHKALLLGNTFLLRSHLFFSYAVTLACHKIFSASSLYRYVRLSIFDMALHKILSSRKINVVVLEQWIIQELWSATIFKRRSHRHLARGLQAFHFKANFVFYLDIDPETACERIQQRSSNLSRFDRMEAKTRLSALNRYNEYLYQIYKNSRCKNKFTISPQHSPAITAAHLLQHLEQARKAS